jgi:hypothetical protein
MWVFRTGRKRRSTHRERASATQVARESDSPSVEKPAAAECQHYQNDDEQSSRVHVSLLCVSRVALQPTACSTNERVSVQLRTPVRDAFTDADSKPALSYARAIAWSSGCQRMNRPSSTWGASCGQTLWDRFGSRKLNRPRQCAIHSSSERRAGGERLGRGCAPSARGVRLDSLRTRGLAPNVRIA